MPDWALASLTPESQRDPIEVLDNSTASAPPSLRDRQPDVKTPVALLRQTVHVDSDRLSCVDRNLQEVNEPRILTAQSTLRAPVQ